jgi:hypothetical protein
VAHVDSKWIDNLLSHFDVPGVSGGKQGAARRITELGIAHIVLIRRLSSVLSVRIGDAVTRASDLLAHGRPTGIDVGVELRIDREVFLAEVARRIEQAAEAIVPARRGRPSSLESGD